MPGEKGPGHAPETIAIETDRQKELREMTEKANEVIAAAYDLLREQFEEPSDETVHLALIDMVMRDPDQVPSHLRPYMGWDITEIPAPVVEQTRGLLKMPYHNVGHSQEVVKQTELIMEAMVNAGVEISSEAFQLGRKAASMHDAVQRWKTVLHPNGKLERVRYKEENERQSLEELKKVQERLGDAEFDEEVAQQAFDVTIPGGWDGKTVVQTYLKPDTHPVARAVALADLGAAGMNPDLFIKGGNQLFVEENLDMLDLDVAQLDEEQKEAYMERMLLWSASQITFARGRKGRFEAELGDLPEAAKKELRALFNAFDESIQRVQEHVARRRGMSFEDLYEVMGFRASS